MSPVKRPLLRWLGSKFRLAPWIISHLPPHELYCEPYGGSASVLMRKPRSKVEVLGDLDDELLNLYAVMRDPAQAGMLQMLCVMTPFSDAEFRRAREMPEGLDPVERARRLLVRHAMQVSPDVRRPDQGTGFRRYTGTPDRCSAAEWATFPDAMADMTARLQGVVIERDDAVKTIRRHDRPDALFYLDPPYVASTRREGGRGYAHELDDVEHRRLLDCLLGVKGMVVLSGYAHPLYDATLADWRRITRDTRDLKRNVREEVLWISPRAVKTSTRDARQPDLFMSSEAAAR